MPTRVITQRADARVAALLVALLYPVTATAQTQVSLSMTAPEAAPRFNGARVVGVRKSTPLLHRLAVTGERPLTFAAQGLPAGLQLDAATGVISGSVAADGESTITVTATNTAGTATSTLKLVVGDQLSLTPPIGWNSYDSFDDAVTESEVVEQATWLRDHLQPFGWDLVTVDFRWYDPDAPASDQGGSGSQLVLDSMGRYQPAPNRFPKGFKALGEQIHAMGLKFGIHIMRGIPRRAVSDDRPIAGSTFSAKDAVRGSNENGYTCVWNADMYGVKGDTAAGQAWYDSIFAQYAEWGVGSGLRQGGRLHQESPGKLARILSDRGGGDSERDPQLGPQHGAQPLAWRSAEKRRAAPHEVGQSVAHVRRLLGPLDGLAAHVHARAALAGGGRRRWLAGRGHAAAGAVGAALPGGRREPQHALHQKRAAADDEPVGDAAFALHFGGQPGAERERPVLPRPGAKPGNFGRSPRQRG